MLGTGWSDSAMDDERIAMARNLWTRLAPLTDGFYTNAMTDDEAARLAANYGENYPRLQRIKKQHDPQNLFRLNANIRAT